MKPKNAPEHCMKKRFITGLSSNQNLYLKKVFFQYGHKILSVDEVIPNIRPNQGKIFCYAPTQIQGEVTETWPGAASSSQFSFRMRTASSNLSQETSVSIFCFTIVVIILKEMVILVLEIFEKEIPMLIAWVYYEQLSRQKWDKAETN